MSKILEDFPQYLEQWCKTNHKPVPPVGVINKYWQLAWQDYMKNKLVPEWEDIKQDYLDMEMLTKDAEKQITKEDKLKELYKDLPDDEPEEQTDSMWNRIKKQLN